MYVVLLPGVHSFFCFKQKTAYEMRISDWSSDVCSSDLCPPEYPGAGRSGMLRRTRPVSGVSELYPVRPGAKPWKAADDGREGGILHQRALSAPRIQAGEG